MSTIDLMWKCFVVTLERDEVSGVATDMADMRKRRSTEVSQELAEYLMFVGSNGNMTLDMPDTKEVLRELS